MASQPVTNTRKRCPEQGCRVSFKRKSDLERHRKCVHHRKPNLGNSYIYQCTVPGCFEVRRRLDHFKLHVKRAHSSYNVERISQESAILIVESETAHDAERFSPNVRDYISSTSYDVCQGSLTGAMDLCVAVIDDKDEVPTLADSGIEVTDPSQSRATPFHHSPRTVSSISRQDRLSTHEYTDRTDDSASCTLLTLIQKVQAEQLIAHRLSQLHNALQIESTTAHQDCNKPVDGVEQDTGGQYGDWKNLSTQQGNGFDNGKGKGKRPLDRQDQERDHQPRSEYGPDGASDKQAAQLPCVCHRFNGPDHDPFPDCSTRKLYMSGLWVHHTRHHFFFCWTCFGRFASRLAVEDHRRAGCRTLCVTPRCNNYNSFSSPESPCNNHGNYIHPKLLWQMLYRKAHGLSLDAWVPDPLLEQQQVPPGLPADHYMAAYSQPLPHHTGTSIDPLLQQADTRFGGGMYGEQFNQPIDLDDLLQANLPSPSASLSALTSLLENLWEIVNTPDLLEDEFISEMYHAGVRPPDQRSQLPGVPGEQRQIHMLEVLAQQYMSLIGDPGQRTLRAWTRVTRMTRGLLGVAVPLECPWDLSEAAMSPLAGPSRLRQRPQPTTTNMNDPFGPSTNNNNVAHDATIPANVYQNPSSIPRVVQDSTNSMFLAVPQAPNDAPSEASRDRRASLASTTSPSDAMYNSAPPSFIFTPSPDGVGGTGFQQIGTPTPSRQQQMENGEVDEGQIASMEDIDWTSNMGL